ncbi:FusB/FusC family EF-G-binding protein [Ornithinibacillus scapharcae]|uniref:FusB/FusC family EF-G-binding protein n=1 Tax=Ornithinibacillus scapharcae TaxID=1147159 RepID=UPI000225BD5F|nr:elongation factor G-binding protein [Ornithinibacillus scapharcae]
MEAFIRVDQYNFIKRQVQNIVNAQSTSNDHRVRSTIKSMAFERVCALFPDMTAEQEHILKQIPEIDDKEKADQFLIPLKQYVIPFAYTEQRIAKLFPKVKKLKVPKEKDLDLQEICYLSWTDYSTNQKFIVINANGKPIGLHGSFDSSRQKGICVICNGFEEVGLFLTKKKGEVQGTYSKKGNYICRDSEVCNHNIVSLDPLQRFTDLLK